MKKIASAAKMRPLQVSSTAPISCGSNQPDSAWHVTHPCDKLSGNHPVITSKPKVLRRALRSVFGHHGAARAVNRQVAGVYWHHCVFGSGSRAALAGCANFAPNDRPVSTGKWRWTRTRCSPRSRSSASSSRPPRRSSCRPRCCPIDPAIAERAARLAHQLELTTLGLRAADRWNELAPDDERAVLVFRRVRDALESPRTARSREFEAFIDAIGDPATGLALVLEALSNEPYADASTAIMRSLTNTFPGTGAGHYALARLALRSGDFDLALASAQAATESDPDWLDAQLLYARSLLVAGRTADSLAIGARLAEEHNEVEVQLQYAELLLSAGRSEEAETLLDEILADNPGLPEATRALAFLALTEERLEEAKQYFGELRGDGRYRSEAFYYLGRIAETERDFLQATRSYSRVTDGTHAVEAQLRTARIMFAELNDPEGAVRHLREFGDANPRFTSNMLVAQSQLLLQMQQPARGDGVVRRSARAIARRPDVACRARAALRDPRPGRRRARSAR